MSQGSKKESKARLQALPSGSSSRQEAGIKADYLLKVPDGNGEQDQINNSEQSGSTSTTAKKPLQNFDTIRDPYKSMLRLIDCVFDLLQIHVYEANQANEDSKLQFHLQRPTLEKQANKSWLNTVPELPAFTGKIYTCDWSLILKGTNEIVMCYVIPSDRVISLNSTPEIYKPYLAINFFKKGSNYGWQIDNQTITSDHLPALTKKIFEKLLKSVRNQQWNESTFCLEAIGIGSLNEEEKSFGIKTKKDSEHSSHDPVHNPAHDPEQIFSELIQAAQEAALTADEFKIKDKDKKDTTAANLDNQEKIVVSSSFQTFQTFEGMLKLLVSLLDKKLEQLVGEGAEALSKHDFKSAQTVLTLTNHLHEFKNKASEILTLLKQ